jgi:hypothetical protein
MSGLRPFSSTSTFVRFSNDRGLFIFLWTELYSRDEIRSTLDFHAAAGGAPYNAINGHRWASDRQRAVCKASSKKHLRKAPSESQCTVIVSW